jgi:hypothetical protein
MHTLALLTLARIALLDTPLPPLIWNAIEDWLLP